jgi:hypothetical protein
VKVEGITGKGVKVLRAGLYPEFFEADTVVLAMGMVSDDEAARNLAGKAKSVLKIGDALKPASVAEAIESGFKISLQI